MRSPSLVPQPAVARLITNKTTNMAIPESAAHGRRRRLLSRRALRRRLHLLIVILLFLLWPWSLGVAGDLPRVHVAAASGDAAAARVDLSSPIALNSPSKWTGYLDFLGKPGTARTLGQPDLFLPLLQDANDLTFFNLRGQLQFDNTDVHEYNIGLGHRHMFQEWILGGYGYYDQRHTQLGNSYNQFTGGLELMSVDWALRMNGYLPENKTTTDTSGANASVIRPGDQIKVQIGGIVQEKALPGVDGEVGYLLPIPWRAYTAVFDETRVYAGGYHFLGEDNFDSVTGPRGRVEWRAYDLPVLGPGSRFMMGVEAQWDEPRGSQAFGLASLRIPFDVFADKSKRKALKGLDRRMLQPVIRDVDVVTSQQNTTEITAALNPAGKAYTKARDVTREEYNEAIENEEDDGEVIAYFIDNNGVAVGGDQLKAPGADQTGSIVGKELKVRYQSNYLGAGWVGYTPGGTSFMVQGGCDNEDQAVVTMNPGSHLNGMMVDATGCNAGIRVQDAGTYYVTNSEATGATEYGLYASGADVNLTIRDSAFNDNIGNGIRIETGAHVTASYVEALRNGGHGIYLFNGAMDGGSRLLGDNLTLSHNGGAGMWIGGGTDGPDPSRPADVISVVRDSTMEDNHDGVFAGGGVNVELTRVNLINNRSSGAELNNLHTVLTIRESYVAHNDHEGLTHSGFNGHLEVEDSIIEYNGWDGIFIWEGTANIRRNLIRENNWSGIMIGNFSGTAFSTDVHIEDVVIEKNGERGLWVTSGISANVTVTGSTIKENSQNGSFSGVDVNSGTLSISDSFIVDNKYHGMTVTGGASITATRITVTGNEGYGVHSQDSGSRIDFNDSLDLNFDNDLGDFFEQDDGEILIDGEPCTSTSSFANQNCLD